MFSARPYSTGLQSTAWNYPSDGLYLHHLWTTGPWVQPLQPAGALRKPSPAKPTTTVAPTTGPAVKHPVPGCQERTPGNPLVSTSDHAPSPPSPIPMNVHLGSPQATCNSSTVQNCLESRSFSSSSLDSDSGAAGKLLYLRVHIADIEAVAL